MKFLTDNLGRVISLIFSVTIATVFIGFMTGIISYGRAIEDRQQAAADAEEYSRYAIYDSGGTVTGSQVLSAARKFARVIDFFLYIKNGATTYGVDVAKNGTACFTPNTTTYVTSYTKNTTCSYTKQNLEDNTNPAYVALNGTYTSYVLHDASGRVSGLYFIKQ